MAETNSNVIVLPAELMAAAQQYASEVHKSVDEVAEQALRFYIDAEPELNALRQFHKERAAALGLTPEEYVMQVVKESRTEKRLRTA
jgi:hypothetical protein